MCVYIYYIHTLYIHILYIHILCIDISYTHINILCTYVYVYYLAR